MDAVWTLSSSDGWNQVSGRVLRHWTGTNGKILILCNIVISGQFWQRDIDDLGELRDDFHVCLAQVIIPQDNLKYLFVELDSWLCSPKQLSIGLCDRGTQRMTMWFGVKNDFICSIDRPVCEIRYTSERMPEGRWAFVVDQSCIKLLHDDLATVLHAFNGKG